MKVCPTHERNHHAILHDTLPIASPLFVASNASIDAFCDALWLEHGLSRNTLDAYRRDLRLFCEWLAHSRNTSLDTASEADLTAYSVVRQKDKSTSANRRLSVFRRYYAWAVREHRAAGGPDAAHPLGQTAGALSRRRLSEAQVEALLGAPDIDTPLGLRDRTMLELMYASGLRVTELVTLKTVEVGLNEGVVRVMGKGSKERLIPFGEEAHGWIERYLREARPALLGARATDALFVTTRARGHDAPAVLEHHQASRGGGRRACAALAAYAAACVRDASAESRRRFARRAIAARPHGYFDHADLHARGARAVEVAACEASSARVMATARVTLRPTAGCGLKPDRAAGA